MRTNKVILIAGNRKTGKTNFIKNMLFKMTKVFPKCLVVDTFDSDVWHNLATYEHPERLNFSVPVLPLHKMRAWKSGVARIFDSDTDLMMEGIQEDLRNCFLVFEDATKYVGNKLTKDVRMFVLDSKQKNLDIVFIFHSLMAVPPELLRISDILILFKTNDGKLPAKYAAWGNLNEIINVIKSDENRYINYAIQLN